MTKLTFGRRTIATSLFAVALALTAGAIPFLMMTRDVAIPDSWGFRGFKGIFALAFSASGYLILRRHPGHVVGWLLLVSGVISGVQLFGEEYGIASYHGGLRLPAASVIAWLNVWIWVPIIAMLGVGTVLYFPDGRLFSPRWRTVLWLAVVGTIVTSAAAMADPTQTAVNMRGVPPPFDPRVLGTFAEIAPTVFSTIGLGTLSLLAIAASVSIVLRFRRARGPERQQIKSFALSAGVIGVAATLNAVAQGTFGERTPWQGKLAQYALIGGLALVPISIGIAIRRYRLYDIDLVIRRTLVYGALSAALAATYFAAVALLQTALRPLTGGSELAVAGSTLAVVALAAPLRRRIQGAVDRRFYRSRYDAARTLDAFSARLRDQVELDAVRADLVGVVHETIRPAHASVWLRERAR